MNRIDFISLFHFRSNIAQWHAFDSKLIYFGLQEVSFFFKEKIDSHPPNCFLPTKISLLFFFFFGNFNKRLLWKKKKKIFGPRMQDLLSSFGQFSKSSSELVTSIDAKMDEIIKLNWYSNFLTGMVFNFCRWLIKQFEWWRSIAPV